MILAVFEHLVDEFEHAFSIAFHHLEMLAGLLGKGVILEHFCHGATYEREWGAKLMTDVGKEAALHLSQFTLQHSPCLEVIDIEYHIESTTKHQYI